MLHPNQSLQYIHHIAWSRPCLCAGTIAPAGSAAQVHLPLRNGQLESQAHSTGQVMPSTQEPASSFVGIQSEPAAKVSTSMQQGQASALKPAESIDLTAESDEEAS